MNILITIGTQVEFNNVKLCVRGGLNNSVNLKKQDIYFFVKTVSVNFLQ